MLLADMAGGGDSSSEDVPREAGCRLTLHVAVNMESPCWQRVVGLLILIGLCTCMWRVGGCLLFCCQQAGASLQGPTVFAFCWVGRHRRRKQ